MTESLARLLLRLSEAGEPAILWGRQAKPYFGREFERLLDRGVLIEEAPAAEWEVCASCECELDSRPIQQINGKYIAACPFDHASDVALDFEDLRSFHISPLALVREIATASGLGEEPSQIASDVWRLGLTPTKRTMFLALTRHCVLHAGMIAVVKAAERSLPITLVAPALTPAEQARFVESGIHVVVAIDAIAGGATAFSLDVGKLVPPASIEARLTLVRPRRSIVIDGHETELPPRSFDLLWLLAQEVTQGGGVVGRPQIEKHLWGKQVVSKTAAADAIRDLREDLSAIRSRGSPNPSLIETRHRQGYILTLPADTIRMLP